MACCLGIVLYIIICCTGLKPAASQDNNASSSEAVRHDVCFGPEWSCVGVCGQFRKMPCSCDDRCFVYNTCCEDFLHECPTTVHTNVSIFHKAQTMCLWNNLLLIAQCPPTGAMWTDISACLYYQEHFEDLVPVTDTKLGLHFRNTACARCNGLVDTVRWQVNMSCYVEVPQTLEEALKLVKSKGCLINFEPPLLEGRSLMPPAVRCLSSATRECTMQAFSSACRAFTSYVRIKGTDRTFANRFCLLCQGLEGVDCDFPTKYASGSFVTTKFSSLMNWVEADGTWTVTDTYEDQSAIKSCSVGSKTAFSVCKVRSCPEGSVPYLNDTYCVSHPRVQVLVFLAVDDTIPEDSMPVEGTFTTGECISSSQTVIPPHILYHLNCNWGTISTHATKHQLQRMYDGLVDVFRRNNLAYRIVNMTTMFVSIHEHEIAGTEVTYIPTDDNTWLHETEWTLSVICTSLSITCLSVRVLLQPFSYLLHTHPGTMQFCLCVCLLLAYTLFLVSQKVTAYSLFCWVISLLLHWAFLSSLVWMHAITYDLWGRFRYGRILSSMRERRSLKKVSIYCCLSPSLIVGTACIFDRFYPSSSFSPMYGYEICWINQSYALIVFFVGPASFLCAMNLVLIVLTFRDLHVHYKSSKFINSLSTSSPVLSISICSKMTCLTGATWLIGLLAGFVNNPFLWMAFTVINSSCGLLVGVTLMWNKRLWRSLALPWKKSACVRTCVTFSRETRQPLNWVYPSTRSTCSSSETQSSRHM